MEKKGKFGSDWIEGFAKEAMDAGAGPEDVKALLKVAVDMELCSDPKFIEGASEAFEKSGMDKQAGIGSLILAGLGGAGLTAGIGGLSDWWRNNFRRGEMDRRSADIMDMANRGLIDWDEAVGHARNQYINRGNRYLQGMGAQKQDPYAKWYNFG